MRKSITGVPNAKMQDLNYVKQIERTLSRYSAFNEFQHYRDKLSLQECGIYDKLKNGILSFSEKIDISLYGETGIEKVYRYVMLDTPMIFHVDKCNVFMEGKKISVRPKYKMSSSTYRSIKDECLSELNEIKSLIEKGNEWDIMFGIHTYLIDTVLYHEGGVGEHDIMGPLLKKSGVCDGIAKTVKSICDYVGFPCVVIEGEAQRTGGKIGRHAWNAIKIDGKWNYYDFTFDITLNQNNPCKSIKCVDYFGLGYSRMSNDHFSWSTRLDTNNPQADYFAKFKLVIARQGELENMILQEIKKGNSDFAFRIAEHWKEFVIKDSLEQIIDIAVKKFNQSYRYTYIFNEKQRTGYVHIT